MNNTNDINITAKTIQIGWYWNIRIFHAFGIITGNDLSMN